MATFTNTSTASSATAHPRQPRGDAPAAPRTTPRNTVLNGDCTRLLTGMEANSVDFILTDPPYITRYRGRDGRTVANDDNARWLKPAFAEAHRVLKPGGFAVSFYGWNKVDLFFEAWKAAGFRIVGHLVFRKRYASSATFLRYEHEHLPAGQGQCRPPRGSDPGRDRFPLYRQQAASDAEAGRGADAADPGLLAAGRSGPRPVLRLGLDAGGGAVPRSRLAGL